MSIIHRNADPVNLTDTRDYTPADVPTSADLDGYGRWLASRDDLDVQAVEPTPVDALVEPCEADDDGEDWGRWWDVLPRSYELDGVSYEPTDDAPTCWIAEGQAAARRRQSWNPEADRLA